MRILRIFLTVTLAIGFIIPGCNMDLGCDCSEVLKYFDIKDFKAEFEFQNGGSSNNWQDLVGEIIYETEYYGAIEQEEKKLYGLSFIPTASACSCPPDGWSGSEEGLDSLIITTVNDYNANYPAGSNISGITEFYTYETGAYESFQEFISRNEQAIFEQVHYFKLKESPAITGTPFKLNIRMVLNNGEEYDVTTQEITVNL